MEERWTGSTKTCEPASKYGVIFGAMSRNGSAEGALKVSTVA